MKIIHNENKIETYSSIPQHTRFQMKFTNALKWSFLSELASKLITPVIFIILARLLTPEDFGVMTAALMVFGFSQIFWEAGMGKALIQHQTDIEAASNVAFWINMGLGLFIASLLFITAKPIANTFFHDDRVSLVIQVMTLQVFIGAASSVHTALLQKNMEFKNLFWIRFITVSLPAFASIPLALSGMGYWALIAGAILGQFIQAIVLWYMSPWRPTFSFRLKVAKEIVRFGSWVGASSLLAWFYIWADSLIVSMYFGSYELGIYRTANQLASMIFTMLFGPIIPVLYSYLSKIDIDEKNMQTIATTTIKLLILLTIPIGIVLFQLSPNIEKFILGDNWQGISFILGMFFLVHGFAWVVGMNGEFFRAIGKPKFETIAMLATAPIFLVIYILFIKHGLHDFMIARLSAMFIGLIFQLYLAHKLLNVRLIEIYTFMIKITIISILCVWITSKYIVPNTEINITSFFINATIYVVICTTVLFFLEKRKTIKSLINFIKP